MKTPTVIEKACLCLNEMGGRLDDPDGAAITKLARRVSCEPPALAAALKRSPHLVEVVKRNLRKTDSLVLTGAGLETARDLAGSWVPPVPASDWVSPVPPPRPDSASLAGPPEGSVEELQGQIDPEITNDQPDPAPARRKAGSHLVRQEVIWSKQLLSMLRRNGGILYFRRGNQVLRKISDELEIELDEARHLIWHMVSDSLVVQYVAWKCVYGVALAAKETKMDRMADDEPPIRPSKSRRGSQVVVEEDEESVDADAIASPTEELAEAA